jgi:hypothetical protein
MPEEKAQAPFSGKADLVQSLTERAHSIDVPCAALIFCALVLSYAIVRALVAVVEAEDKS